MHNMDYGWGMGFGWVFMVAFWAIVILGVIYLVKLLLGGSKCSKSNESALDILKKRYANGEISKEEFETMKKDIV
jgi:putative membrane protein